MSSSRHAPRSPRDPLAQSGGGGALSARERDVLERIVARFIQSAAPVGSKSLADEFELSSASLRTTMRALEEAGYLGHPHTSAGRVPTARGYRLYVDELMDVAGLRPHEAAMLRTSVHRRLGDLEAIARESSRLLGRLAQLLGVVLTPRLSTGVLERLDVVALSSHRVLFVLAIRGGLARTVQAEVEVPTDSARLDAVVQRLNERLAGLTLGEIRETGADRLHDLAEADRT
ncbi:MAG: heat-inducible transcription repressor HrcA, partial [Bacteroidota bacterium]